MDPRKANGGRVPRAQRHRHQEPRRHRRRKASRRQSTSATTWCATMLLAKIGETLRRDQQARQPRRPRWSGVRDRRPFGRARLRQLSAEPHPHQRRARRARSIPPTTGSCSAPASASGTSRRPASSPRDLALARGAGRARATPASTRSRSTSSCWRPRRPTTPFRRPRSRCRRGSASPMAPAFDLQAVCSGFVYALATADGLLRVRRVQARAGDRRRDLLAHPRLERSRRPACCSATAPARSCSRRRRSPARAHDRGILTAHLRSDGRLQVEALCRWRPLLDRHGRASAHGGPRGVQHAVAMITDVVEDAFEATGYSAADIDWFVPHQANKRIIDGSAHKLGIAPEKDRHHGRPPRQYLGRLDPAGARGCASRRAHQARRSGAAGGHGRRLHLGRRAGALVSPTDCRAQCPVDPARIKLISYDNSAGYLDRQ